MTRPNSHSKKFKAAAKAIIAFAAVVSQEATIIDDGIAAGKQEKCYGIVKAGRNDCANAVGTHSCAGYAVKDSDKSEWILLPHGVCERIAGAYTEKETLQYYGQDTEDSDEDTDKMKKNHKNALHH